MRRNDLIQTKAMALFVAERPLEAEKILQDAMQKNPKDQALLTGVIQISALFNRVTNAVSALDRQLDLKPDDVPTLLNKAFLELQLKHFEQAIPPLSHALTLETNNYNALLQRAYAYVNCQHYNQARQDYDRLRRVFPTSMEVNSGLAEIAWREKDTNTAIYYYQLCLTNSNPGPEQSKFLLERLQSLKGEKP